jgi:hypothetical protein
MFYVLSSPWNLLLICAPSIIAQTIGYFKFKNHPDYEKYRKSESYWLYSYRQHDQTKRYLVIQFIWIIICLVPLGD